jgi:hypothetical protein
MLMVSPPWRTAVFLARVHHPLGHVRVGPERPRLPQHRVDQRGLAVVDVRDDGDVAQVVADGQGVPRDRGVVRYGHA